MDRADYLQNENWYGSFYELALELGPTGDDDLAMRALRALWAHPHVRGPWREQTDFDSTPRNAAFTIEQTHLYGCYRLHDGTEIGCMSHLVREDNGSDWLDLSIPTGMLARVLSLSYPLHLEENPWMPEFDDRLAMIGSAIYASAPFWFGLIGEEASGMKYAAELSVKDCVRGGVLVPLPLWNKLAPPCKPVLLGKKLAYAPRARESN